MKPFKQKQQSAFIALVLGLIGNVIFLFILFYYWQGYQHFWIVVTSTIILDLLLFRYINHHFLDTTWLSKNIEETISTNTKRLEGLETLLIKTQDDPEKLKALQEFWNLPNPEAAKERITENLALTRTHLDELQAKKDQVDVSIYKNLWSFLIGTSFPKKQLLT